MRTEDTKESEFEEETGSLLRAADGSLLRAADGSLLRAADGSLLREADGSLLQEADGSLLREADGSLLQEADGSLLREADGSLLQEADGSLDACGLSCPLPLLKAKQGLNKLQSGQILSVVCTDAGSVRDFKVFCEQSRNHLLESRESEGKYYYRLQKA